MRCAGGWMDRVGDDAVAVLEVRGEHAVVSGEMGAGAWNEGGEAGDEVAVRDSQSVRRLVSAALDTGARTSWDYQPMRSAGCANVWRSWKGCWRVYARPYPGARPPDPRGCLPKIGVASFAEPASGVLSHGA